MGVEQAYIERLKAARARMGFVRSTPIVNLPPAKAINDDACAPTKLVETISKKWTRGRPKGSMDGVECLRKKQAVERYARAVEAREKLAEKKQSDDLAAREIVSICASYFGVNFGELKKGASRRGHLPYFRQMTIFVVKDCLPSFSLSMLGGLFGGYNHTTILHAIRQTEARLASRDPRAVSDLANLRLILRGVEMCEQNYWGC